MPRGHSVDLIDEGGLRRRGKGPRPGVAPIPPASCRELNLVEQEQGRLGAPPRRRPWRKPLPPCENGAGWAGTARAHAWRATRGACAGAHACPSRTGETAGEYRQSAGRVVPIRQAPRAVGAWREGSRRGTADQTPAAEIVGPLKSEIQGGAPVCPCHCHPASTHPGQIPALKAEAGLCLCSRHSFASICCHVGT